MTSTISQAAQKIETALAFLETEASDFITQTVEPAVDAEFDIIKPQILALGETVLSQVWTAALTYLTTGGSAGAAVASIVAQLPADLQALEHLVMAAFAGAVQSISAKAAGTAADPAPASN